ncbi:winged helix-turn-helix domain-containing protein [Paenibacillus beijingensis]|uniref:OmpR/PhoB-type domain-containing protein n=1 Tax=Paenibacillus beijingensis TaxID=1126833 RepID=A0A0D5NGY6_9BACL|nr:response regulator transcription factor [Paenibacillus beijingensis]AJY74634.1 hypothetical protein VN24_08650 [Paenibacillus beijingensis]
MRQTDFPAAEREDATDERRLPSKLEADKNSSAAFLQSPFLCAQTRRIVVVSPFPTHLHELIRDLSADCYDVLVFHRVDDFVLNDLQSDIYVVDGTHPALLEADPGIRRFAASPDKRERSLLVCPDDGIGPAAADDESGELLGLETVAASAALARIREMMLSLPDAPAAEASGAFHFKDLYVDTRKMVVTRDGRRIDLTKTEFELLRGFLDSAGAVRTREEMMEHLWDSSFLGGSNVVDVHVKSLRKKLGDSAVSPKYIETVRGVGYRLAD